MKTEKWGFGVVTHLRSHGGGERKTEDDTWLLYSNGFRVATVGRNRKRGFGVVSHSQPRGGVRRETEDDTWLLYQGRFTVAVVGRGILKTEKVDSGPSPLPGPEERNGRGQRRKPGCCIRKDLG